MAGLATPTLNWEDILDLHVIKKLTQIINRRWQLGVGFASTDGKWVKPPRLVLGDGACEAVQLRKPGMAACEKTAVEVAGLIETAFKRGELKAVTAVCHAGLREMGVPIVLGGELLGAMLVGGFIVAGDDAGAGQVAQRLAAPALGLPRADADRLTARQPRLSPRDVDYLTELMELCAEEIVTFQAEIVRREQRLEKMQRDLNTRYSYDAIIGRSRPMQEIYRLLDKVIDSDSTVLISGENGTGKELVAKAIHHNSARKHRRFVIQNCSAFNDNLLESALFGHVKGAFTGAIKDKKGLFEIADGGSFILDEIGDMSPALQVKLLRVLQEGTFTPVGGTEQRQVDVRVIAATHKDLQRMVERGEFREDLYYRINVIKVVIPPLRERMEDLPILCEHFLKKHFRGKTGKPPPMSDEAMVAFQRYPWPGNIRELENEIERLLVLGGDLEDLPVDLLSARVRDAAGTPLAANGSARPSADGSGPVAQGALKDAVEALERDMIRQGLVRTHWNKSQLAKELGISRSNLIMKVERYGLDRKGSD